jgi:formylglycine-generating enzyme required for sulfatase activity
MKWKEFQDDEKKDDEKSIQARREKDYLWRRNELKKEYDRFLPDLRDALVVDYAEADGDREDFVVAVRNRFSEVTWFLSPTSASERQRQFCEKILRDFLADLGVSLAKSNYDSIYYLFIDYRAYRGIPRSFVHAIKSAIPLFVDSCEENEITKKNPEELNSPSDYEYVLRIAFGCFAYLEKNEHDQLTLSILDDKRYSNWLADYLNAVAPSASQSTIPYLIFNNDKSKLQGISREWTDVFNTMVRIYLRSKKYAQGSVVVSKDGSGVTSATASPAPVSAGSNAGSGQNIKVLFDKAIKLRENREIPNAKIEFQNCISATPATVEEQKIKAQAYIELGLLLEQEKDYTEARGKYDACFNEFQSYSQEIELLILCARALNENGNSFVREAKNNTDDAKKNDFHSQAVVEFMKCIDFVKNSKQSDTRLLVEQARALNNKGDATTTLDDKIKAFGECAKFVGDANDPALRFEKMQAFIKAGTALYDEGKVKKGVEAYNELIKNKIDNIFAPTRDVDLEFRPIPAGEFDMGSPENEDGRDTEEQQHKVIITKPFLLGKTPVTQGQWKAVMSGNPSLFKKVGDNAPVERVSWDDAVEFCKRLTEQERAAGRLPEGYAYALPTEAQWEYACRAGGSGAYGRMEDGKEGDLDKMGWYPYNSNGTTHPVAQKKPNAWGLYDMHGNVWEWCADWYADDYYARSPAADPSGPDSGSVRVSRGGSRSSIAPHCRSAFRGESAPSNRDNHYGFRLALRPVLGDD